MRPCGPWESLASRPPIPLENQISQSTKIKSRLKKSLVLGGGKTDDSTSLLPHKEEVYLLVSHWIRQCLGCLAKRLYGSELRADMCK